MQSRVIKIIMNGVTGRMGRTQHLARSIVALRQQGGITLGNGETVLPEKLNVLIESGFFGRILSVRGEFGYWVFEGDWQAAQRPSWNYRKVDGGGIIVDMFCHWRYVLDNLFGQVSSVCALGATHIPKRVDENGDTYAATADDAAYAIFELAGGVIAQMNSSWCARFQSENFGF
jgi:predicted dehydrogenase